MKNILLFMIFTFLFFHPILAAQNDVWEIEEKNFWKFDLESPRGETNYSLESEAYYLQEIIVPLIPQIYKQSSNKINTFVKLQKAFAVCSDYWATDTVRQVCKSMVNTIFSNSPYISSISLPNVLSTLKNNDIWIFGIISASDIDKHYPLLEYPYMTLRSRCAIWDYLFGIADAYPLKWLFSSPNFDGIAVLKAEDTHWQEFAKIIDPLNPWQGEKTFLPRNIDFKNNQLTVSVFSYYPDDPSSETSFLVYEFTLQQNGSWKHTACLDAKEEMVLDENGNYLKEIKKTKTTLASCNGGVQVITTLS